MGGLLELKDLNGIGTERKGHFVFTDGYMYCEDLRLADVYSLLKDKFNYTDSPAFVFSKNQIEWNVNSYMDAMRKLNRKCTLNYAVKANMNPAIMTLMKNLGCAVTLVSGYEHRLANLVGFDPARIVLNGNGKHIWEIELAIQQGCLLNIDSMFNLQQTIAVSRRLNTCSRVLIRVNPDIDPPKDVHQYNVTGKRGSKFGVSADLIEAVTMAIKEEPLITLVGVHCHLGSTITDINVFRKSASAMLDLVKELRSRGFRDVEYINLGGGLGIDYKKHSHRTMDHTSVEAVPNADIAQPDIPTPAEVVTAVDEVLGDEDVSLILEPGRSLIGNAGVLVTRVMGVKHGHPLNYIVTDSSMTEVIRPALYSAYHHIDLAEPTNVPDTQKRLYDIVGPVCESGDFIGKGRYLAEPHEGCALVVCDVGAYCGSMASNYNMRPRPVEVMVDGSEVKVIRRPDTLHDMLAPYNTDDLEVVT